MANSLDKSVCIIGAGMVGSLLSIYLGQRGFKVDVFEKRNDPRLDFRHRGRTIAMSLSERGLKALEEVGLDEEVKSVSVPSSGRMIHLQNGSALEQLYSNGSNSIYTIDRNKLNTILIDYAEKTGNVEFHFNHHCQEVDFEFNKILFVLTDTGESFEKPYNRLFGTDGAFSEIRKSFETAGISEFKKLTLDYGYKELKIPENSEKQYSLDSNFIHLWSGKGCFLIGFPHLDKSFICTLFLPLKGESSFESLHSEKNIENFFANNFPDIIKIMPDYKTAFLSNPVSKLVVTCGTPWSYKLNVLLIGDASHSITPFYGMGMNTGFEDCSLFIELLEQNNFDFEETISGFESIRKCDTDAITELSLNNFKSISSSPDIDYHKKWLLERRIWKLFPRSWIPAYVMIVFSHIPFSRIKKKITKQDKIISEILKSEPEILSYSDKELRNIVRGYFAKITRRLVTG